MHHHAGKSVLSCTFRRMIDTKVRAIQAASHKGADGGLELAGRDVRKLYPIKLHAAEFKRRGNHDCSKWATSL